MLFNIKKMFIRIFDNKYYNNDSFTKYLRKNNITIGKNTYFFNPKSTTIDINNGKFIEIGNNCKISKGVVILAHDYSYSVLRPVYNDIPKKAGETIIGDNVFIGINSIILMGSKIGNNVIIGAGSVVSGTIPNNEVWCGNPAKFICTLDDYYKKCKNRFEENAFLTVRKYREKMKRNPTIEELHFFSLLFLNNDTSLNNKEYYRKMSFNGDDPEEKNKTCMSYKSKYNNYKDFIEHYEKYMKKR